MVKEIRKIFFIIVLCVVPNKVLFGSLNIYIIKYISEPCSGHNILTN